MAASVQHATGATYRRPLLLVLLRGLRAQRRGIATALVSTWLGIALAIEAAAAGALVGAMGIASTFLLSHAIQHAVHETSATSFGTGADAAFLVFAVIGGAIGGAAGGFGAATAYLTSSPEAVLSALVCGAVIALATVAVAYRCELWVLARRGYRRLSFEEDARVRPLLEDAARAMGVSWFDLPALLMVDAVLPAAHAHMRALVLSRGLVEQVDDAQLAGILAHELAHWRAADPVGSCAVWAAALPLALIHGLLSWVGRNARIGLLTTVLWLLLWPVDLSIRLVIAPVAAADRRAREYAADAAAAAAGPLYRDGLRSALVLLSVLEQPRTGWEEALIRSHPPVALRIERLVPEEELRRRTALLAARAAAFAAGAGRAPHN